MTALEQLLTAVERHSECTWPYLENLACVADCDVYVNLTDPYRDLWSVNGIHQPGRGRVVVRKPATSERVAAKSQPADEREDE